LILDNDSFERPFPPTEIAAVEDSIEELEKSLNFPAGSLQRTASYYNEHAARRDDPLFHKGRDYVAPLSTPHFAALDYTTDTALYTVFTMGGLHTTIDAEVLTADGETIPGLYAAGRTTSGIAAQGYSSGLSIADATFYGRRAGRAAAAVLST